MTLTTNHRKLLWISAIAIAVWYTPSAVNSVMRSSYQRQVTRQAPRNAPSTPAISQFRELPGIYQGREVLPARGMCSLKLEIRHSRETNGAFSGYSTITCTWQLWQQRHFGISAAVLTVKPTAAIMTGTPESNSIRFTVNQVIGNAVNCAPTGFTTTRFGQNQLAVKWQDACHGGQMLLNRTGR